jgi:hypothetical protein
LGAFQRVDKKRYQHWTYPSSSQYLAAMHPSQPQYLGSLLGDIVLAMSLTYLTVAWWAIGHLLRSLITG